MHTRFNSFSHPLAILFAVLFVIATILTLLFVNSRHTLLNADAYKRALMDHQAYEQLPALLAEGSSSFESFLAESCTDHALVCAMDGAPPELQACLTASLGEQAYVEIGSRERQPTASELDSSESCLDRYANTALQPEPEAGSPDENLLLTSSAEVQACVRQLLGDETYETLYEGQRPATLRETRRINRCIREVRREARLNHPGLGAELMPILNDFSPVDWEQLIRLLLPPEDLRQMTESGLDQVFAYLNGERDTARVSLVDVKARLAGPAGQELILFLLNSQPPCTGEQQAQIDAGNFENRGATAIYCAATGETLAKMIPPMQKRLSKVAAQLPDEAVLIQTASDRTNERDPLIAIRTLHKWIQLSPLMALSLLGLMTVLRVRSIKDLLHWWGIPLFSAGLLALSVGLAAQPLLDWAWVNYIVPLFPPVFSSGLVALGHSVLSSMAHELGKWVMLEAGLIALLGLAGIIGSFYVRPPT